MLDTFMAFRIKKRQELLINIFSGGRGCGAVAIVIRCKQLTGNY